MKYKSTKGLKFKGLAEWHRTTILFLLLLIGVGVVVWTNTNVNNNFVDQFEELDTPQAQAVTQPEVELENFVRTKFIAHGRIIGHLERKDNKSFVVNALAETDYSINVLPDEGKPETIVVAGSELHSQNDAGVWAAPISLDDDKTGYGATAYTPTNKQINDYWKQTKLQPDETDCATGKCAHWQDRKEDGSILELLFSSEGQIVKLYIKTVEETETTIDYSYSSLPTVAPGPTN